MTNIPFAQPTDPPDLSTMNIDGPINIEQQPYFLQTLLTNHYNCMPTISNTQYYLDMSDEIIEEQSLENSIPLSIEGKTKLYSPWKLINHQSVWKKSGSPDS